MNWLDRLERRFGAWGIHNFPLFIVAANGVIFLISQARPDFVYRLMLDPYALRQGEWWRAFTFLFVPPPMWPLLMMIWLLVVYQFAQALEHEWGNFRFCVFYAIGALATVIASLAIGQPLSNVPLNTTVFLAFSTLFPDMQMYLFYIFPIKVKYLAGLFWLGILWGFVMGSAASRIGLAASLVNYAVFFGPQILASAKLRVEVYKNRRRFKG